MVKLFGRTLRRPWINEAVQSIENTVNQQRDMIKRVEETTCPKSGCDGRLSIIGYENHYGSEKYELAVLCKKCDSRFIFTEKGIRAEYTEK